MIYIDVILAATLLWLIRDHHALGRYVDQMRRIQALNDERLETLEQEVHRG